MREPSKLSHSYIVSSASMERCLQEAARLAATAVCSATEGRPCGLCRHCRKAGQGIHPDVGLIERLVDDEGRQKKEILVDQIRQLSVDACVLPNEAEGKAYIIRDADTMNNYAQNAALKLLEEPPKGVVFILCACNAQKFLPTVRSRCVEISLAAKEEEADENSLKLAREFVSLVADKKAAELCRWCGKNEGMDQQSLVSFLNCVRQLAADILCGRFRDFSMSTRSAMKLDGLACRCLDYTKVNVGVKHIIGLLMVDAITEAETEDK